MHRFSPEKEFALTIMVYTPPIFEKMHIGDYGKVSDLPMTKR
jgi:hypothetical protein